MTLRDIFPRWFKIREMEVAPVSLQKNRRAWDQFFDNSYIVDVRIDNITRFELKAFVTSLVRQHSLTKHYYTSEIKSLLNSLFDFAVELGALDSNYFRSIRLNPRIFRPVALKHDMEEVFTPEEQHLIMRLAHRDAVSSGSSIPLGVCLLFYTGLRIGELCALRWSDIAGDLYNVCILSVFRMQVVKRVVTSDGIISAGYDVVSHPKSAAGCRQIVLPDVAVDLIQEIHDINLEHGISCEPDDYLFMRFVDQQFVMCNSRVFDSRIRKYCRQLHFPFVRSPHDIRRTYISALLESGMSPDTVRRLAGHENIEMTLKYCRSRVRVDEICDDLNNIFRF